MIASLPCPRVSRAPFARWDVLLKRPYWSSAEAYKHGVASLDAKGWSNLHEDGTWTSGTGIALRWQEGPEFVRPSGRSLSSLIAELYHKERYSDAQIENILDENAALGRSLEGRLFDAGWIPVGAAFGPSDEAPLGFFGARLLASAVPSPKRGVLEGPGAAIVEPFRTLKSSTSCDVANPVRDDAFSRTVENGIAVVGRSGAPAQVSKSTNLQLKAESASRWRLDRTPADRRNPHRHTSSARLITASRRAKSRRSSRTSPSMPDGATRWPPSPAHARCSSAGASE